MAETQDRFLRDVREHELIVVRDNGEYRHLRFKKPGTTVAHFDLVTWPGHLCFTGDMGTYVFSRLRDMFEFFRDNQLRINPQYWSEKVLARDRDGIQEWSPKRFRDMAGERVHEYFDGDSEQREKALEELASEVLVYANEEWEAAPAYLNFRFEGFQPEPEDLSSCYEYTFRFIWCCHAIVWGIQQYDAHAAAGAAEEARTASQDQP